MGTNLKAEETDCKNRLIESERSSAKSEEKLRQLSSGERLRQLNLVFHNYSVEVATLQAKLKKDPDDIVRQARLKMIQEYLMPRVCDLILHFEA
ncbi:MAG: hypothetical protein GF365_03205 [Candidatus Buchananbacteria bacterium]|nr:hypothetical protein [Candidatus Buchananbacteria bacterium]